MMPPLGKSLGIGPVAHLYGWGIGFLYQDWRGGDRGRFWKADLTSFRYRGEARIPSAYRDQGGKNYFLGRTAYVYWLQVGHGREWLLIPRSYQSRLQMSVGIGGGATIAVLKPYYIEVAVPVSPTQAYIQVDLYDPAKHSYSDIVGEGDFWMGLDKLRFIPGLHAEVFSNWDFAGRAEVIRSLVLSLRAQGFALPVEMSYVYRAYQFRLNFVVAFYIGNAWK